MKLKTVLPSAVVLSTLFFQPLACADITIDDFNTNRTYAPCCGEYGAYDGFMSNVVQNGNGTLTISGNATDNGGFYREGFDNVLWNLTGPTNLVLRIRSLPNNTSTNLYLVFRDAWDGAIVYTFSWTTLSSNSFTNITKSLLTPDGTNEHPFIFGQIRSIDVSGDYSDADGPMRLELDSITAVGPVLTFGPAIEFLRNSENLVLRWPTNQGAGFNLQSATNITGSWSNEPSPTVTGTVYQAAYVATNGNKFFRLVKPGTGGLLSVFRKDIHSPRNAAEYGLSASELPEGGALSSDKAVSPPPGVTYYSNFIDVASYSGWSSNADLSVFYTVVDTDIQTAFDFTFSDHTGGTASYNFFQCDVHTASPNPPYSWIRQTNHTFTYQETFSPGSTNWPNGLRTETGYAPWTGSAGTNRQVSRPFIPYAHISGMSYFHTYGNTNRHQVPPPGWMRSLYRTDETELHLHTGRLETNQVSKYVLLAVSATYVSEIAFPSDVWPEDGSVAPVFESTVPVSFSNITCLEKTPNADGRIFSLLQSSRESDATLSVSPETNYLFSVAIVPHKMVYLTRTYHPFFEMPPFTVWPPSLNWLQNKFAIGSEKIGTDDDVKILDSAAPESTNASSPYRTDDAPAYVEFRVSNGTLRTNQYRRLRPVFPPPFHTKEFHNITEDDDAEYLLDSAGASVKQVKTLKYKGNENVAGIARPGGASMVIEHDANSVAHVHEWGHMVGFYHRNETNQSGAIPNPGDFANALMNITNNPANTKINHYERDVINALP